MSFSPPMRRFLAIALLVALVVLPYALVVRPLVTAYDDRRAQLAEQEELLRRYRALASNARPLKERMAEMRENVPDDPVYLSGGSESLVGADLQNRVKTVVESSGGRLASTQVLPASEDSGFRQITIRVRMTSDIDGLHKILHALETSRPYLFLDNIDVNAREGRRGTAEQETELTTTFDVFGFMQPG